MNTENQTNALAIVEHVGAHAGAAVAIFGQLNTILQAAISTLIFIWWVRRLWKQRDGELPPPPKL
jgi:hypothetical protein